MSTDSPLEPDPRVLQKSGEIVYTSTKSSRSNPRYHATADCRKLDEAYDTTERDRAVAEWQGCDPCQICHDLDKGRSRTVLTAADVDDARASVLEGASPNSIGERHDLTGSAVRRAIRDPERGTLMPPLRYNHGAQEWQRVEVDR